MADHRASHERLAALTRPADGADRSDGSDGRDAGSGPDPGFWGTEPRSVRRTRPDPDIIGTPSPRWWAALLGRARDLRLEVGIGVVVVALVAVVAGIVWYRMGVAGGSGSAPPPGRAAKAPTRGASTRPSSGIPTPVTATGSPTPTGTRRAIPRGPTVVVHVAGAVARPGVLVMPAGARVVDAVEGAGGGLPDADLDRINLAAELVDGQRILVSKIGALAPGGGLPIEGAPVDGALIDLNTATTEQLEELPGIGPALAGAILAERERRGGFRSVNELREVRGIGDARFADLRDRVTV